jgi:hypothetical protein
LNARPGRRNLGRSGFSAGALYFSARHPAEVLATIRDARAATSVGMNILTGLKCSESRCGTCNAALIEVTRALQQGDLTAPAHKPRPVTEARHRGERCALSAIKRVPVDARREVARLLNSGGEELLVEDYGRSLRKTRSRR